MKKKQEDMSETLTRAGIERLMRGVSKTNIGDIEDLKFAKQLKTELKKKDIKKWLLDTGRSLKKRLLRS
jgi:histone H3/H4